MPSKYTTYNLKINLILVQIHGNSKVIEQLNSNLIFKAKIVSRTDLESKLGISIEICKVIANFNMKSLPQAFFFKKT